MKASINDGNVFLRRELSGLGISRAEFREMRHRKLIRQVTQGVWVDSTVPDGPEVRFASARLVMPEHAVFCNGTAAWLNGVDTFKPSERFLLIPQCVVPVGAVRCTNSLVSCREAIIPDEDVLERDGVLYTDHVRTTSDLLRELWRPYALAGADGMARAGLVEPALVQDYVGRLKGYRWIVQARELAFLIEPLSESPGESWQRLRIVDAGLPIPRAQTPVVDSSGDPRGWLDLAYEEWKVGMEYDGREFHSTKGDVEHDQERRQYFRDVLSWRIAVVRREDLFGSDMSFELQIGEWIGRTPLPRAW